MNGGAAPRVRGVRLAMRAAPAWVFVGACSLAVAALALAPAELRVVAYHTLPPWPVVLCLGVYFAVAVGARRVRARRVVHAALAAVLLAMHLAVGVQPLGDSTMWRSFARSDVLSLSEPLANLTYRVVNVAQGDAALGFVAPVAGALFAFVVLGVAESLLKARTHRVLIAAAVALAGWHVVFARGYVENPQLSMPVLAAGLGSLARYARGDVGVARPAAWLVLATMVHGMNAAMLPALAWCVVLRHPVSTQRRELLRSFGVVAAVALVSVGALFAVAWAAGFEMHAGHVTGGGDNRLFVPLQRPEGVDHGFTMFEVAHAAAIGNVVLLGCPLVLAAFVGALRRRWRRSLNASVRAQPAFAIAGLGGLGSASVFCFDLGFPGDLDLMLCMTAPAGLLLLQIAACAPRRVRWVVWTGLVVQAAHTLAVTSSLLVLPQQRSRDGERDLTLNLRVGEQWIRPGESLFVELQPPLGAATPVEFALWMFRGEPPPGASLAAGAVRFAVPGEPGHDPQRTFLLLSSREIGIFGAPPGPLSAPWATSSFYVPELGVQMAQARFIDAAGRTSTSNTIVVRER